MVSETRLDKNQKIAYILDIGATLLSNGSDVHRVEDTIMRLGSAFGFTDCQVHAINSSIIMTVTSADGTVDTHARRIRRIDTDLNKVSELNNLSRLICSGRIRPEYIPEEFAYIRDAEVYSPFMIYIGYIIAGAFFTLFFGGSWYDFAYAVFMAAAIRFMKVRLSRYGTNKMVDNIILSALLSFLALAGEKLFPVLHADMLIIGNIMLLIPGLAFCNSIHDMAMGDTISGILSLSDALLRALAIAIGYVAVWTLMGRFL